MESEVNPPDEKPVTKQDKIVHQIYVKAKCKALNELTLENFHMVLTFVMRQVGKKIKYGFTKKKLVITIMLLLLGEIGIPELVAMYAVEGIAMIIEHIYNHGYHRIGTTRFSRLRFLFSR